MRLIRNLKDLPTFPKGTAVSVGNFDGVHLGHQALLAKLKEKADELNIPTMVVLFEPQPVEYFLKKEAPARINTLRKKIQQIKRLGIDWIFCLKFNEKQAGTAAKDFVVDLLISRLNCQYFLVGEDFRFGHARQGDLTFIRNHFPECHVESFPDYIIDNTRVSSTSIRKLLDEGRLQEAHRFLGRDYGMCGRVMRGDGRGGKWGIHTANLAVHGYKLSLHGVYCVRVKLDKKFYNGVANIGCRPSVDGEKNILEVHLLDFQEDIYGKVLDVYFLQKLRDEVKFPSIDELIRQIKADIKAAEDYFATNTVN